MFYGGAARYTFAFSFKFFRDFSDNIPSLLPVNIQTLQID